MKNLRRVILATFFLLILGAVWASADDDPPSRVARLQYMNGSVSIQPHGNQDWVQGSLNQPLTNADNIWTDKDSKAELNVGGGVLRMGDESSLTLTNVTNSNVQVELHQGTLNLHVRHLFGGEIYEVDTPNIAFTVQKGGDYRFDVDPNGDTTVVTVRKGEGDATGNGPGVRIRSDEQARFSNGTSLEHTVAEAPAYDGFDSWCGVRDKREDNSISARYVAPGVIGYEDLDDNGVWREVPTYGHIWVPTHVEVGWAPYHYGHWGWVDPWGWTWIDDAPWGFAPFHYGRWVYYGGGWGWAPGPVYVAPVYAPALVAWFGGPSWGVSFGFGFGGGFGWCPLGWGEPFYPWYHYGGFGYFRSVNISNTRIVNINNFYGHPPNRFDHYVNYRAPGAFTAVPARTLQNGLPVSRTAMHLTPRQMGNVPVARSVGVTPNRNAVLGAHAGQPASMPPSRTMTRPVMTRTGSTGRPMNGPTMANNGARPGTTSGPLTPSRMIPHGAQSNAVPSPSAMMHNVPRPPSAGGAPGSAVTPGRGFGSPNAMTRNVPRPPTSATPQGGPSSGMRASTEGGPRFGSNSAAMPPQHNVPRPSSSGMGGATQPSSISRSTEMPRTNSSPRSAGVPRPSGPVRSASEVYGSSSGYRGNTGGASRYGAAPNYRDSSPYRGSSSSPSYRGSSPAPSYRGGYSSAPSYRGGYSSAPSYHASAPSYRGSSPSYSASAPSYHGGGGYTRSGSSGGGGGHSSGGHSGGRR